LGSKHKNPLPRWMPACPFRQTFVRLDRQRTRSALAVFRALWRGVFARYVRCPSAKKKKKASRAQTFPPSLQKNLASGKTQIRFTNCGYPVPRRGVWPSSRTLGWIGGRTSPGRAEIGHRAGLQRRDATNGAQTTGDASVFTHQRVGGRAPHRPCLAKMVRGR